MACSGFAPHGLEGTWFELATLLIYNYGGNGEGEEEEIVLKRERSEGK